MIVVSDTTAVTTLLKAGMDGSLQQLFGSVLVPQAVWDELRAFHPQLPNFVLLRPIRGGGGLLPETVSLGRGEAEAITLAKEISADLLLTDDLKARAVSRGLNQKCAGFLGVLLIAKQRGSLSSVQDAIALLETRGGLYLSGCCQSRSIESGG